MGERLEHPRYALVAPVPRAVEVRIEDAFLGLLGTSKPIMGYHITLVGPFVWAAEPDERGLEQVAQVCAAWPPFAVRLRGLRAFRAPNANAVYIPVLEAESLVRLHERLQAILEPSIVLQRELPDEGYLPHVTLGLGLTDSELQRVMAGSGDRVLDETITIEELYLVEERPSAPWRRVRALPLFRPRAPQDEAVEAHQR